LTNKCLKIKSSFEGDSRVPLISAKVAGGRALTEAASYILVDRDLLLSDVTKLGGWIIADGQTIGRMALNNSALLCYKGVLFLRSLDAKGVTKNAAWLLEDLHKAMLVVSKLCSVLVFDFILTLLLYY